MKKMTLKEADTHVDIWKGIEKKVKKMKKAGMQTEVKFTWCAEDILSKHPDLTIDQVEEVLSMMESKHDCTIGMSWEVLDIMIEEVLNDWRE